MRYAAPLYPVAAALAAVAAGAAGVLGGAWTKAVPVLVVGCVAAVLAGWAAGHKAKSAFLGRLQALTPGPEPPGAAGPEALLEHLEQQLDRAREECDRARNLLARLPFPCMTVNCPGELHWVNAPMAALLKEGGDGADRDPVAAFFARTSAGTWENLRSGRWDGPLLRLTRPKGEAARLRVVLAELGDRAGCWLCLFQDVTAQVRDASRLDDRRAALEARGARVGEGATALESLAGEIRRDLTTLVESMHDSTDQARQVAQAMQEMTDNVRMMATMAAETARTAEGAEGQARAGGGTIKQTAEVTHKVVSSYDQLQTTLAQLMERAGSVGSVVGIISDIADQTNLLALNAAIEAARAGDAGRGFAVVADEVRKLAEKTLLATKEVHAAVRAIEDCSHRAVAAMRATNEDIKTSFDLVMSVEDKFSAIAEAMVSTARGIDDIAHRAEQQCASSFEINMCAMNVTDNAQEVYDEVQSASRELERLVEQVAEMRRLAAEAPA